MTALVGRPEPRLLTEPARELTRETTRGYEFIEFCELVLGEPLLPWQRWLALHALELNPDGTYRFRVVLVLVGRQNGKTHFLRALTLWRQYMDGVRLVLGVAQDVSLAREVWQACIDTIKSVPDLKAELEQVRRVNGDEQYRLTSGVRYKIAAANRSAGRGLSVDQLNMDEIREQRSWDAWSALSKTTMARPYAQTWAISNAGDDRSVVLNHLREAALAGRDPSIGIFEWSAPDGCTLDDPQAWAQANPGLGHTVSEQAIRSALASDPPAVFRTEVLCQRVDTLNSAIDMGAWKATADQSGSLAAVRERVVLCLDVAPDGQHATLAGAAKLDDGRIRVEILAAWSSVADARRELFSVGEHPGNWSRDGVVWCGVCRSRVHDGVCSNTSCRTRGRVPGAGLLDRIAPFATGWFPTGPAAELGAELRGLEAHEVKGTGVNEACMELSSLIAARRVVHPDDPLLNAHLAGASKLASGDGWRFARQSAGHVDAAYAVAGAVHLVRTLPEPVRRPSAMVI